MATWHICQARETRQARRAAKSQRSQATDGTCVTVSSKTGAKIPAKHLPVLGRRHADTPWQGTLQVWMRKANAPPRRFTGGLPSETFVRRCSWYERSSAEEKTGIELPPYVYKIAQTKHHHGNKVTIRWSSMILQNALNSRCDHLKPPGYPILSVAIC